jgi:hypothetical protein
MGEKSPTPILMRKFEAAYIQGLLTLAEWDLIKAFHHIATNDGEMWETHNEVVDKFIKETQELREMQEERKKWTTLNSPSP